MQWDPVALRVLPTNWVEITKTFTRTVTELLHIGLIEEVLKTESVKGHLIHDPWTEIVAKLSLSTISKPRRKTGTARRRAKTG
jgi:hypothetical protein